MLFHILHVDLFLNPVVAVCFVVTLSYAFWIRLRSRLESLPGPTRWPIFGNIPDLAFTRQTYRKFLELRDKYGDIVQLRLGPNLPIVVVFGHEYIHELLVVNGDKTRYRPNWLHLPNKMFKCTGVLWSNGDHWHVMRKFTIHALKELGFGDMSVEPRVQEEADYIIQAIQSADSDTVDLSKFVPKAVSNIISGIVFGKRFDYDDEEFNMLLKNLDYVFKNFGYQQPSIFFPFMENLDPCAKKILQCQDNINAYLRVQVLRHEKTFQSHNIRDFIDMYINQQNDDTEEIQERSVFQIIFDLYAAGSETSSTALLWIFLYLTKYPTVQAKCVSEIRRVIGLDRKATFSDRDNMPYLMATISEIQRMSTLAALSLPHTSEEDIEIDGKVIQKDSVIIPHLYSAHYDDTYWTRPHEFKPERFIDKDRHIIKHKAFYPFSLGPRACPGKQIADVELFIFTVSLLQTFAFTMATENENLNTEGLQTGVTLVPVPYKVKVRCRKQTLEKSLKKQTNGVTTAKS